MSGESPELIAAVIELMKAKLRLWDASTVVEELIGFDVETNGGELDTSCACIDTCDEVEQEDALMLIVALREGQTP